MPDLTLTLGGVVFQDFEVPETIHNLGGRQMLVVQKLVGGDRDIQAMGRDDADPHWTGRFRGAEAITRARAVDALRISGQVVALTFGDISLNVVVDEFTYDIERGGFEVPYGITLVVEQDNSAAGAAATPGVDEMLAGDNGAAQVLGSLIGDPALSGLLGSVGSALGSARNLAAATGAQLQTVLGPITAAQERVGSLIGEAEATFTSATSIGGVTAGLPLPTLAANLQGHVAAMTRAANLYDLQNLL